MNEENPKEAIATQKFIEIRGVKNGILILKNGGLRQILMVSGLNFDLKSEDEQNAITQGYQAFLNSLSFTVQIFVHSRKLNIDGYIQKLAATELQEPNPLLRNQLGEYREFIRSFVSGNTIMTKTFFVVVPFDGIQLPELGQKVTKRLFGLLSKKAKPVEPAQTQESADEGRNFQQNANQLSQRVDQVTAGLNQIGLRAVPLNDDEVIELFYNLYNPEASEKKSGVTQKQKA
jgi:type IV secretory pathway VirB4 component